MIIKRGEQYFLHNISVKLRCYGVSLQLKPIRRFTAKTSKLLEKLAYHNPPVLDELILRTADKQLILIASAGSKTSAKSVGKVLAAKTRFLIGNF